jgi:hypothetical protein
MRLSLVIGLLIETSMCLVARPLVGPLLSMVTYTIVAKEWISMAGLSVVTTGGVTQTYCPILSDASKELVKAMIFSGAVRDLYR